jgi:phasin family protein
MVTTSEFAKTPVEFFTAANQAFKERLEKSMAALTEVNAQSKQNLEAFVASATAAAKGAETVGAHALAYSKKSLESQVAAAKALSAAKSLQEAMELQSGYAKTAFEAFVAEVGDVSEIAATSVKNAISPINERVTAFVERVQAPL